MAIGKIEELMQQELPNLVDERRFRKREPDFERDELGRVSVTSLQRCSASSNLILTVAAKMA